MLLRSQNLSFFQVNFRPKRHLSRLFSECRLTQGNYRNWTKVFDMCSNNIAEGNVNRRDCTRYSRRADIRNVISLNSDVKLLNVCDIKFSMRNNLTDLRQYKMTAGWIYQFILDKERITEAFVTRRTKKCHFPFTEKRRW